MVVDYTKKAGNLTQEQASQIKLLSVFFSFFAAAFLVGGIVVMTTNLLFEDELKFVLGSVFVFMSGVEIFLWNKVVKKKMIKQFEAKNEIK